MLTLEQAIEQYQNSERMNKEFAEKSVYPTAKEYYLESAEKCRQMIEYLRELQERREKDNKIGRGNARWIISSDGYYPYCSACMAEPKDGKMADFCPSCGARMEGKIT